MSTLRRALYLLAAVWALAGAAFALFPRLVLVALLDQPPFPTYAWLRLAGIQGVGLAMLMVLVAHRVQELWWWAWAFAFVAVTTCVVLLLNAAFGLGPGESALIWWVLAAVALALAAMLLYALAKTSQENPII